MHIYIYIYILSFRTQLITTVYLDRKTMNGINKNYPKQWFQKELSKTIIEIIFKWKPQFSN